MTFPVRVLLSKAVLQAETSLEALVMEDKKTLGEYIAQRRKALGLTQRQFAERLYVTDSAVSKWERGLSYPDITLLHDICKVLDISEHELLTAGDDAEARRAGALARRYLRLVRGWKLGQLAVYGGAALACFIADLSQDGALSWAWVVLSSLILCASLTLTPALAPERMGGLCTLGAFTLALELLLAVCCLYVGGDWFFVAGASVLFGLCLLSLPYALGRLTLPAWAAGRRGLLCLGADLLLFLGLLGVCCLYVGGDWFWITAVSVIFAAALLFLPIALARLPLPGGWGRHRAALWLGAVSLLLLLLLGTAALYSGGGWFFRLGLPAALGCLLLPWGLLLALRYLPAGGWLRASAACGAAALWYWLFPWGLDRLMRLNGWESDELYEPFDFFGVNFMDWAGTAPASRVMFIILAVLVLAAVVLAAVGLWVRRRGRG